MQLNSGANKTTTSTSGHRLDEDAEPGCVVLACGNPLTHSLTLPLTHFALHAQPPQHVPCSNDPFHFWNFLWRAGSFELQMIVDTSGASDPFDAKFIVALDENSKPSPSLDQ